MLVLEEFVRIFKFLKRFLKKEQNKELKANILRQRLELLEAFLENRMMQELMWCDATGTLGGEGSISQKYLDLPTFIAWLRLDDASDVC